MDDKESAREAYCANVQQVMVDMGAELFLRGYWYFREI